MRRGTTPTVKITIKGIDITEIKEWFITLKQDEYMITKLTNEIEIDDNEIRFGLTEEETLDFRTGKVAVQIRAITVEGLRIASDIKEVSVASILNEEVI